MWFIWIKLLVAYTFRYKVSNISTDTLSNLYQNLQSTYNYSFIGVIWCLGIIGICIFNIYKYIRFKRLLSTSIPENINIQGKVVKVYRNDFIDTALVNGIVKPKIYISVRVDNQELEYVYEHEAMHITKHHNIIKALTGILTIVYWFNPIIWIFYKVFLDYIEMMCDYECCKKYDKRENWRNNYAKAILKLAVSNKHINMRVLGFNNLSIERRVKVIMKKEKTKVISIVSSVIVMLVVVIFLFVKPQDNVVKAGDNNNLTENNNIEASQHHEVPDDTQFVESYLETKINEAYNYKVERYSELYNDNYAVKKYAQFPTN